MGQEPYCKAGGAEMTDANSRAMWMAQAETMGISPDVAAEQFDLRAAREEPDIVECYEARLGSRVVRGFRYQLSDGTLGPFGLTRDHALAYWESMMDGED